MVGWTHRNWDKFRYDSDELRFIECKEYQSPRNKSLKFLEVYKYKQNKFPSFMYPVKISITIEEIR